MTTTKTTNTKTTKATKATTKKSNPVSNKTTKQVEQPVDKSVDNSVDKSKVEPRTRLDTCTDIPDSNEEVMKLHLVLMQIANSLFKKQPNHMGYDKQNLKLFVHAPANVNTFNYKNKIKCGAITGEEVDKWTQHMSVILVDELRRAVTRPYFQVGEED